MERDLCLSEAVAFWEVVEDVVALVVEHDDFEGGEFFVFGEAVLFKDEDYGFGVFLLDCLFVVFPFSDANVSFCQCSHLLVLGNLKKTLLM